MRYRRWKLVSLTALVAVVAAGGTMMWWRGRARSRGPQPVGPLVAQLTGASVGARRAAARSLGETVQDAADVGKALPALLAALEDRQAPVRAEAAGALGRIAGRLTDRKCLRSALAPLGEALRDSDVRVRQCASWSLAALLPPSFGARRDPPETVLEAVLEALSDEDPTVCAHAATAVSSIAHVVTEGTVLAPAVPILSRRLDDPCPCVRIRSAAALAAVAARTDDEFARLLGRSRRRAAARYVQELVTDLACEDEAVRVRVVGTLARMPLHEMQDHSALRPAVAALVDGLDDDSAEVRRDSVLALSQFAAYGVPAGKEVPDLAQRVAEVLRRDPEPAVRAAAVSSLARIGRAFGIRLERRCLAAVRQAETDDSALVRQSVMGVSVYFPYRKRDPLAVRRVTPMVLRGLRDANSGVRRYAVLGTTSLSHNNDEPETLRPLVSPVAALLTDDDPVVRHTAAGALAYLGAKLDDEEVMDRSLAALAAAHREGNAWDPLLVPATLASIARETEHAGARQQAIDGFVSALASDDPYLRGRAVSSLGTLGRRLADPVELGQTVDAVVSCLADEHPRVRETAAKAVVSVAKAGKLVAHQKEATERLTAALQDHDPRARTQSAATLVQVGGGAGDGALVDRGMRTLLRALRSSDPQFRRSASADLRYVWRDLLKRPVLEATIQSVIVALGDDDRCVRLYAAQDLRAALGTVADAALGERMADALTDALRDREPLVRVEIVNALGASRGLSNRAAIDRRVRTLATALADADPRVRAKAAEGLGSVALRAKDGDWTVAVPGLLAAVADDDADVRGCAAEAFQYVMPHLPGATTAESATRKLLVALRDPAPTVRAEAAKSLPLAALRASTATQESVVGALEAALSDEHATVRIAAGASVVSLARRSDRRYLARHGIQTIVAGLDDPDRRVRLDAAQTLTRSARSSDSPAPFGVAVRALRDYLDDPDPVFRSEALRALFAIATCPRSRTVIGKARDYLALQPAVGPLIGALEEDEKYVRDRAAQALDHIGTETAKAAAKEYRAGTGGGP